MHVPIGKESRPQHGIALPCMHVMRDVGKTRYSYLVDSVPIQLFLVEHLLEVI
jgi:hypothetical protein